MKRHRNRLLHFLAAFRAGERGNVSLFAALAAVPVLLSAGAALDYLHSTRIATDLQGAVDGAALAAAATISSSAAVKIAVANKFLNNDTDFSNITPVVTIGSDEVEVTATVVMPTDFMKLASIDSMTIVRTATAKTLTKPISVLALNPSVSKAIDIYGSTAQVQATNCVVHSNSNSPQSMNISSGSMSTADEFCAVGSAIGTSYSPAPKSNCRSVQDPYAGLPAPDVSGCDFTGVSSSSGSVTLSPGIYCGGISISGSAQVTFAPGLYVMKNGPLRINSNGGTIAGSEVVFYFSGSGAVLTVNSHPHFDLSAPKSGPYAGFVFIQDPNNSAGQTNMINGSADVKIVGIGYFPTQTMDIGGSGEFGVSSPFMAFVANTFRYHGNGKMYLNLDGAAAGYGQPLPKEYSGSRLVR